jgi:hypothetical protein
MIGIPFDRIWSLLIHPRHYCRAATGPHLSRNSVCITGSFLLKPPWNRIGRSSHIDSELLRPPVGSGNCLYCWLGLSFRTTSCYEESIYLTYSERFLVSSTKDLSVFRRRFSALTIFRYGRLSFDDLSLVVLSSDNFSPELLVSFPLDTFCWSWQLFFYFYLNFFFSFHCSCTSWSKLVYRILRFHRSALPSMCVTKVLDLIQWYIISNMDLFSPKRVGSFPTVPWNNGYRNQTHQTSRSSGTFEPSGPVWDSHMTQDQPPIYKRWGCAFLVKSAAICFEQHLPDQLEREFILRTKARCCSKYLTTDRSQISWQGLQWGCQSFRESRQTLEWCPGLLGERGPVVCVQPWSAKFRSIRPWGNKVLIATIFPSHAA